MPLSLISVKQTLLNEGTCEKVYNVPYKSSVGLFGMYHVSLVAFIIMSVTAHRYMCTLCALCALLVMLIRRKLMKNEI